MQTIRNREPFCSNWYFFSRACRFFMRCKTHTDANKHSTSNLQNGQIVDKRKLHLLSWRVPAFSTSGRRRTVITMEDDQCQQSPQLLDASCNTSDEARVLDSRTRFNPALFLKIFLIYSSSRTSGWQFPSLLGQCCVGARPNVASRCRQVRQKRWPHVREQSEFWLTRFFPLFSPFSECWAHCSEI